MGSPSPSSSSKLKKTMSLSKTSHHHQQQQQHRRAPSLTILSPDSTLGRDLVVSSPQRSNGAGKSGATSNTPSPGGSGEKGMGMSPAAAAADVKDAAKVRRRSRSSLGGTEEFVRGIDFTAATTPPLEDKKHPFLLARGGIAGGLRIRTPSQSPLQSPRAKQQPQQQQRISTPPGGKEKTALGRAASASSTHSPKRLAEMISRKVEKEISLAAAADNATAKPVRVQGDHSISIGLHKRNGSVEAVLQATTEKLVAGDGDDSCSLTSTHMKTPLQPELERSLISQPLVCEGLLTRPEILESVKLPVYWEGETAAEEVASKEVNQVQDDQLLHLPTEDAEEKTSTASMELSSSLDYAQQEGLQAADSGESKLALQTLQSSSSQLACQSQGWNETDVEELTTASAMKDLQTHQPCANMIGAQKNQVNLQITEPGESASSAPPISSESPSPNLHHVEAVGTHSESTAFSPDALQESILSCENDQETNKNTASIFHSGLVTDSLDSYHDLPSEQTAATSPNSALETDIQAGTFVTPQQTKPDLEKLPSANQKELTGNPSMNSLASQTSPQELESAASSSFHEETSMPPDDAGSDESINAELVDGVVIKGGDCLFSANRRLDMNTIVDTMESESGSLPKIKEVSEEEVSNAPSSRAEEEEATDVLNEGSKPCSLRETSMNLSEMGVAAPLILADGVLWETKSVVQNNWMPGDAGHTEKLPFDTGIGRGTIGAVTKNDDHLHFDVRDEAVAANLHQDLGGDEKTSSTAVQDFPVHEVPQDTNKKHKDLEMAAACGVAPSPMEPAETKPTYGTESDTISEKEPGESLEIIVGVLESTADEGQEKQQQDTVKVLQRDGLTHDNPSNSEDDEHQSLLQDDNLAGSEGPASLRDQIYDMSDTAEKLDRSNDASEGSFDMAEDEKVAQAVMGEVNLYKPEEDIAGESAAAHMSPLFETSPAPTQQDKPTGIPAEEPTLEEMEGQEVHLNCLDKLCRSLEAENCDTGMLVGTTLDISEGLLPERNIKMPEDDRSETEVNEEEEQRPHEEQTMTLAVETNDPVASKQSLDNSEDFPLKTSKNQEDESSGDVSAGVSHNFNASHAPTMHDNFVVPTKDLVTVAGVGEDIHYTAPLLALSVTPDNEVEQIDYDGDPVSQNGACNAVEQLEELGKTRGIQGVDDLDEEKSSLANGEATHLNSCTKTLHAPSMQDSSAYQAQETAAEKVAGEEVDLQSRHSLLGTSTAATAGNEEETRSGQADRSSDGSNGGSIDPESLPEENVDLNKPSNDQVRCNGVQAQQADSVKELAILDVREPCENQSHDTNESEITNMSNEALPLTCSRQSKENICEASYALSTDIINDEVRTSDQAGLQTQCSSDVMQTQTADQDHSSVSLKALPLLEKPMLITNGHLETMLSALQASVPETAEDHEQTSTMFPVHGQHPRSSSQQDHLWEEQAEAYSSGGRGTPSRLEAAATNGFYSPSPRPAATSLDDQIVPASGPIKDSIPDAMASCSRVENVSTTKEDKRGSGNFGQARTPLRSLLAEDASKRSNSISRGPGNSPLKRLFSRIMGTPTKMTDSDIKQVKKKNQSVWNACLGKSPVQ